MNTTTSRNILVLSLSVFILSMGQNMWFAFAPEYLRLLGAGIAVVGVFSSLQSFFEAIYNYPAGRFLDRYGLRATLVGANIAAAIGYLIYLLSPNFIVVFISLPFVMIWPAFIVPTTIGLLAREAAQRAGSAQLFTREIMTRLPTLLAPTLGGLLIGLVNNNVVRGVQVGLVITLIASLVTLLLQGAGYQAESKKDSSPGKNILRGFGNSKNG
jgi:MFS family permease